MRVAHSEGRDWRKEFQKFLLGYRSTSHTTTGVSPAKLLSGREIFSKRPGVEELRSASNDSDVLDRDRERKQKDKDCADNLRGACESNLKDGDKVLLQKPKSHKLSPPFEAGAGAGDGCHEFSRSDISFIFLLTTKQRSLIFGFDPFI